MALVLMDEGADAMLKAYFNPNQRGTNKSVLLYLYTNNKDPTNNDTSANYTAGVGEEAPKTLNADSWSIVAANNPSDCSYNQQTWTFTGAGSTIYGYFMMDTSNALIWAEKFATAFTPTNNGDELKVTPKIQLSYGIPQA